MAYYIHWASKFATMIIKHKQTTDYIHGASKITTMIKKHKKTADYIHGASKIATSANKHADKIIYKTDITSIEFKKG